MVTYILDEHSVLLDSTVSDHSMNDTDRGILRCLEKKSVQLPLYPHWLGSEARPLHCEAID